MKNKGRIASFFLIVIALGVIIGLYTPSVAKDINLGLDLQGGFEVLYKVEPIDKGEVVTRDLMEATVQLLNDRVNKLGISEAVIDIEGEDRVRVQLAGVQDQTTAREMLATSARLTFRDVNDQVLLDGSDVKEGSAKQDFDPDTNQPIVTLELKDGKKFADVTSDLSQKPFGENLLVIWMDYQEGDSYKEESLKEEHKFVSAPAVNNPIPGGNVMIEGSFTVEEAQYLANIINSGSLPVDMVELFSTSVGAQFGSKALDQTVNAGVIGIILVFVFMLVVYRFPGLIATINLAIYLFLVLLVYYLMNGVLTLSGIAGLLLGVGMAVDANVITFERIKEELRLGKSVKVSFKAGTKSSFSAILDANITSLIAAGVLFIFGTSSVKGFATMLIISILVSFFTAVWGTRFLLGLWVGSGSLNKKKGWFAVKPNEIQDINDTTVYEPKVFNRELNIVRHRKKFFIITAVSVLIGVIAIAIFQFNPGVDFTSGSRIEVVSDNSLTTEEVEKGFQELGLVPESINLSGDNNSIGVTRFDRVLSEEKVQEVQQFFDEKYNHPPTVSVVSPIVGKELVKNAFYAVAIAALFMIIYVTFRFELYSAVTSVIILFHDAFIILAVFSITHMEFDLIIVSAILTIVGNTINNTVVIFDRLRENLQKEKRVSTFKQLERIVNRSIVQSITRTMNTAFTTVLAVTVFLFAGSPAITGFTIAMLIGLIIGVYSALFLAPQLWLIWRGRTIETNPIVSVKKKSINGPQV